MSITSLQQIKEMIKRYCKNYDIELTEEFEQYVADNLALSLGLVGSVVKCDDLDERIKNEPKDQLEKKVEGVVRKYKEEKKKTKKKQLIEVMN